MIDARFVYLPRPSLGLSFARSPFKASYGKTLDLLERELKYLRAREVVIQAGFPPHRIRQDGWPFGKAVAEHPACILQVRSGDDVLTFRALQYRTFEENLRAIALSLESLRAVDRYGVVQGAQYAGFKQLAAPQAAAAPQSTEDKLRELIARATTDGERQAAEAALKRVREARS